MSASQIQAAVGGLTSSAISDPSQQQEDQEHHDKHADYAGRPPAIGMVAELRQSADEDQHQNHEEDRADGHGLKLFSSDGEKGS